MGTACGSAAAAIVLVCPKAAVSSSSPSSSARAAARGGSPSGSASSWSAKLRFELGDLGLDASRVAHRAPTAQAVVAGGHRDGRGDELVEPLAATGYGGDHRQAEGLRKRMGIDAQRLAPGLVDQVQGDHDARAEVDELQDEVQVARQVGGVDDRNDDVGAPVEQARAGRPTGLRRPDRERTCRAGRRAGPPAHPSLPRRDVEADRHAGVVGGLDGGAGEAVEEGRLADVGVAGEGDHQAARGAPLACRARCGRRSPPAPRPARRSCRLPRARARSGRDPRARAAARRRGRRLRRPRPSAGSRPSEER